MAMKVCPRCGKYVGSDSKFCEACGYPFDEAGAKASGSTICPQCGKKVKSGASFCPECGYSFAHPSSSSGAMGAQSPGSGSGSPDSMGYPSSETGWDFGSGQGSSTSGQGRSESGHQGSAGNSNPYGIPEMDRRSRKGTSHGRIIVIIGFLVLLAVIGVGMEIESSIRSASSADSTVSDDTEEDGSWDADGNGEDAVVSEDVDIETVLDGFGDFEEVTVSGDGDDVIDLPSTITGSPVIMDIMHDGEDYFEVSLVDDDGTTLWSGYERGSCDDTQTSYQYSYGLAEDSSDEYGYTMLTVRADGNWSVTFRPMSTMEGFVEGQVYEGSQVLYLDGDSFSKITFSNTGEDYFTVVGLGMDSYEYLVDSSGSYEGTVLWADDHAILIVYSDGEWSATLED